MLWTIGSWYLTIPGPELIKLFSWSCSTLLGKKIRTSAKDYYYCCYYWIQSILQETCEDHSWKNMCVALALITIPVKQNKPHHENRCCMHTRIPVLHAYANRWMNGWFAILRPFTNISVISERWADDNERLCAVEPRLRLKRSSPQAGLELTTARSVGQRLTHTRKG